MEGRHGTGWVHSPTTGGALSQNYTRRYPFTPQQSLTSLASPCPGPKHQPGDFRRQFHRKGKLPETPRVTCMIVGGAWKTPAVYRKPRRLGRKSGRPAAGGSGRRGCGRPRAGRRRGPGPTRVDRGYGHRAMRNGPPCRGGGQCSRSAAGSQGMLVARQDRRQAADLDPHVASAQVAQPALLEHPAPAAPHRRARHDFPARKRRRSGRSSGRACRGSSRCSGRDRPGRRSACTRSGCNSLLRRTISWK